jgi:carboxyl-terminal processing protease
LALIWFIGACVALLPAVLGSVSLGLLERRSRYVAGGSLFQVFRQLTKQLGIERPVRLLVSDARTMPMTWGIWRPAVLIPRHAERWSQERLQMVFMHELAHVQRLDCGVQLLAQIARAVYWFNPLAWLSERQVRRLQEQACDDLALQSGFAAPDYAEHLLAVSTDCRTVACAGGLAMAHHSKLEQRVQFILSPQQNRRSVAPSRLMIAAIAASLAMCPLASIHFDAVVRAEPTTQAGGATQAAEKSVDRVQLLAELRAKIAERYVTPVDERQIVQGAIRGMLGALDDPYSDFLTPENLAEMERQISSSIVGIGVQLERNDQQIRIVTPLEDSPALKAGLQAGDVILQIDRQPATGIALPEVVKRIAGTDGTAVKLTIRREGNAELNFSVTRGPVKLPTVKGFHRGPDNRWSFLLDPERKVGYMQVAQFGSTTPQELRQAIEALKGQGLRGLILDLRYCPGGLLESAVSTVKLFLSEGTIVSLHGRDGEPQVIRAGDPAALTDVPLVVLVNAQTGSSPEIVAGALQDNHRAVVLGTRTVGKGSVQSLIKLDDQGGAIKLTTSHYRLPSGRNIDRSAKQPTWGIDPDEGYFVPLDAAQNKILLERRRVLEILGKTAINGEKLSKAITPQSVETEDADPQLAAALKTMLARLTTGQYEKVSTLNPAQIAAFLKRQEIQERRDSLQKNLEDLNRELAELDRGSPTKN